MTGQNDFSMIMLSCYVQPYILLGLWDNEYYFFEYELPEFFESQFYYIYCDGEGLKL